MGMTRKDAYELLELPVGSDEDSIRTSYKRLSIRWHPDKHNNSSESLKKFRQISVAYKRLSDEDFDSEDEADITLSDMYNLFQQIFFPGTISGYSNGYDSSEEDDDDDDDDGMDYNNQRRLTPEEIEKNANELITEEEKEKRRAEKRRAKKKRRREKKRQEKIAEQKKEEVQKKKGSGRQGGEQKSKKDKKGGKNNTSSDEDNFDASAAFFTKVISKKKKSGVLPESQPQNKAKVKDKGSPKSEDDAEELDPTVLRSRQLAMRGNEMANLGQYPAAISLFTDAIKLDPQDFRFFGNRSYCYDRIQMFEKALRDADKAISLAPDWPKGYFRKGRALAGLKLYAEGEQAFTQVLKLDRNCEDANEELLRVRTCQLTEMGFSKQQAESAIQQYGSVQAALDSLLAGVVAEKPLVGEVYMSDDDDSIGVPSNTSQPQIPQSKPADVKMDPANPEGLTALWVGNVLPEVSEKKLTQMFSKYGVVTSVRCLPDKYCAFINYKTKESAGKAMGALQGMECAGQRLLIKFPDNPIVNGNVVIRKNNQPTTKRQIYSKK